MHNEEMHVGLTPGRSKPLARGYKCSLRVLFNHCVAYTMVFKNLS